MKNNAILPTLLPPNYKPSKDEEFMNSMQLEYFRQKLLKWQKELIKSSEAILENMQTEDRAYPDNTDVANLEVERSLSLKAKDRQRKLIGKIDKAIARIKSGEYGYCEKTGEPISIKRLEARPIATLSIEAQEEHERKEKNIF